ncbi:MAG: L-2-amino-thiazoline-4-carboxylic acid hydrolase [Gemmataceae bacterium]|nr:L-2-amino-thiazoline-4-carboxylic acid hydrolase [Gemmataceae bacterium]
MTPLPLLQQREIEAAVIAPLVQAFASEVGDDRARDILAGVIRGLARQGGCAAAAAAGGNTLAHLKGVIDRWRDGGALELAVIRDDADALDFNVTRCRYAEMYSRLGLADLGAVLSCSRDGAMIEGFNPAIHFTRTQTILGGASHCDFRYRAGPPGSS